MRGYHFALWGWLRLMPTCSAQTAVRLSAGPYLRVAFQSDWTLTMRSFNGMQAYDVGLEGRTGARCVSSPAFLCRRWRQLNSLSSFVLTLSMQRLLNRHEALGAYALDRPRAVRLDR